MRNYSTFSVVWGRAWTRRGAEHLINDYLRWQEGSDRRARRNIPPGFEPIPRSDVERSSFSIVER
jgi:hypothetical protein